jgi:hypothetical protein
MTEKHAHVRRLLGKEGDMCTRGAHAATSLTNLGDKVRELRHVPNLGATCVLCYESVIIDRY